MRYLFGDYTLDAERCELRQTGRLVSVEPRVFDLLAYLVYHPGRNVLTEELLQQLYPDEFAPVERLTNAVAQARRALQDTAQAQHYIQTVRRRGYRFIAPVTVRPPAATDAPSPPPATPRPPEGSSLDPAAAVSPPAAVQAAPPSDVPPAPGSARLARATGPGTPDAERRQLTILFCDLMESTVLASQLDPEDYREVVRTYQETCAKVIAGFDGHIAQYLGDGLLVYFGYPLAHEDDAQRAVRAGLGMLAALGPLHARLEHEQGIRLAVRLGIHTGLVVVGEVGDGLRQEQLALGETPNIAARLQDIAAPNTLVISAATLLLLSGFFRCQALGTPRLPHLRHPVSGAAVEVDLTRQVLYYAVNRKIVRIFDSSTGGGYYYTGSDGSTQQAITPTGHFHIVYKRDGWVTAPLGTLYRPAYFNYDGYAIHGEGAVPNYPASHGCVRITVPAMDRFNSKLVVGLSVWIYRS